MFSKCPLRLQRGVLALFTLALCYLNLVVQSPAPYGVRARTLPDAARGRQALPEQRDSDEIVPVNRGEAIQGGRVDISVCRTSLVRLAHSSWECCCTVPCEAF